MTISAKRLVPRIEDILSSFYFMISKISFSLLFLFSLFNDILEKIRKEQIHDPMR